MIEVRVTTVDQQTERFRIDVTEERVLEGLENDSATFVLRDEKDVVWFVKSHIIRVKIRDAR